MQGFAGLSLSYADDIAGSGDGGGKHAGFVAEDTGRFAAASVYAEVVGHGLVLSQGWCWVLGVRCWALAVRSGCKTDVFRLKNEVFGSAGLNRRPNT